MRDCRVCNVERSEFDFYGGRLVCKSCVIARVGAWKDAHRETQRAYYRAYQKANRKRVRGYQKRWQKKHLDVVHAIAKRSRDRHKGALKAKKLAYVAKNRDRINATRRAYYGKTKGRILELRRQHRDDALALRVAEKRKAAAAARVTLKTCPRGCSWQSAKPCRGWASLGCDGIGIHTHLKCIRHGYEEIERRAA